MSLSVKPQPPPKPHLLTRPFYSIQRRNGAVKPTEQIQDKTMEELILDELYYDIVRNLPADDIAILMDEHKLLTSGQRDHYRMMKANHQPDVEKSEYLVDCLRKGEPGFLQRLCTILRTLPPSSYIADKIEVKIREMSSTSKPLMLKPHCTESMSKVKSDVQWKAEYRKLEMKTRMQLQAKDREIKRLRKVIRQLQKENSDHLEQLFSEMKSQVENVVKWIDLKSTAVPPHFSSLLKIALSRDGKYGDLYSSHDSQLSSSDMSSNQSTLERHHRRKESFESYQPDSIHTSSSCDSSLVATPTTPTKARNYVGGDPDLVQIQMLIKNVPRPMPVESDISDIVRLLNNASESTLLQQDSHDSVDLPVLGADICGESISQASDWRSTLATTSVRARSMSAPFVSTLTCVSSSGLATDANDSVCLSTAASDELHTPSTVKSDTTSPKSSIQGNPTQQKFNYENKVAMLQQEQGPMADLIAVYKKIQGREFQTQ